LGEFKSQFDYVYNVLPGKQTPIKDFKANELEILKQLPKNVANKVARVTEQTIGEFKSVYSCSPPYTYPFVSNINHNIQDYVGILVTCGSHWADSDSASEENVVWVDVSDPGADEQPMMWVDIFGPHDLTAVCP